MPDGQRFWVRRLRWRLRGSIAWPAFVLFTLLDGIVLDRLPPVATENVNFIEGVLIATFANLFLIGALAPFLARRIERQRAVVAGAGAPARADVLADRIAAGLLAVGLVAALASGIANRPVIVSETAATEENARLVQAFVAHSGEAELQRNLETANTIRLGDEYFRTCIADDERRSFTCVLVETGREPPRVRRDPSNESNERLAPGGG